MHIFIVDDHDLFRRGLMEVLREHVPGVMLSEAVSVQSARKAIQQHHDNIDLVLLDHELPDGKGVELLAELRFSHPALTIAILSAWKDPELMQRALQLGAQGYLPKNTLMPVLLRGIDLILAGGMYIPSDLLSFVPGEMPLDDVKIPHMLVPNGVLTQRQHEVLSLLQLGLSNKQIARKLSISDATVKAHVTTILRSHGVSSRTQLQGLKQD